MMGTILSVLLTILKVIGWILLILLLIVLAILLLVIFCPIRYKGKGYLQREIKESGGGGEVTWLFGLVGGGADYIDHKLQIYAKVLWFKIPLGKKDEAPEENSISERELAELEAELNGDDDVLEVIEEKLVSVPASSEVVIVPEAAPVTIGTDPENEEPAPNKKPKQEKKEKPVVPVKAAAENNTEAEEVRSGKKQEAKEKVPISEKIKSMLDLVQDAIGGASEKIDEILVKIDEKIDNVSDKLDEIEDKVSEILDLVDDEKNQKAVAHVFRAVFKIIGSVLPKHLYLDLDYATGSPDTTGKIFAAVCALPSGYEQDWLLRPDFMAEKFFVEGDVSLTGRVWVCKILGPIFGLLFDLNIWHVVRIVLKMRKKKKE